MRLEIDGVNILPYVDEGGIKWQRNDLDGEDAGRTMDGLMHRGRVATKMRLDIKCKPLSTSESMVVLQAIYPEFFNVTYTDPMYGDRTIVMYSNNTPATVGVVNDDGSVLWGGIEFPLIER